MRLAISHVPREARFSPLGYATLTRDYAILPLLGRSYWPMLAMLSLPYTGYAHAVAKHDKYARLDSKRHQSDPVPAQAAPLGP